MHVELSLRGEIMRGILTLLLVAALFFGCTQQTNADAPPVVENTDGAEPQNQGGPAMTDDKPGKPDNIMEPGNNTTAPGDAPANVKEFEALVTHTGFTPNKFTVNKGDTVRILGTTRRDRTGTTTGLPLMNLR